MLRYLSIATLFAIVVAAAAYLLGAWSPLLPSPLVAAILFVCPSHSFFAATAACEPFDACSLNMLAWVILANIVLYCVVAATLWFTRERYKSVRVTVITALALASAWWASQWV